MILIVAGAIAVFVLLIVLFFLFTYTVVNPNEAHVVVFMGSGRQIYSPSIKDNGEKSNTAYYYIPFLMKREILPLANVKMEIPSFDLKDARVAPFTCEVTCWLRIISPDIAIEKLDIRSGDFEEAVRGTLEEQIRGIARAAAMNQEIIDIMRDRKTFGDLVEKEVNGSLTEWGLKLTRLEIVDIYDAENSTVIADYENMRQEEVRSESRKIMAEQKKLAEIVESESMQAAGIARERASQAVEQAQIEREKTVAISRQEAEKLIEQKKQESNKQKVEAQRTLEVGTAQVKKQALIEEAEGQAEAIKKEGQARADVVLAEGAANANVVEKTGRAEAAVIKEKGLAKAASIDKEADALKKYNEAGIAIETIKATVEVEKVKFQSLGEALKAAKINIVQGGVQDLFGMQIGPEQGAGFAQMLQAFSATSGIDIKKMFTKEDKQES